MTNLEELKVLLKSFKGATFASLDAITEPKPGIFCETKACRVILYRMTQGSGYENKVKRHLLEAGKDPSFFTVGDLPWGTRVEDLPLIEHKGKYYLQTLVLSPGASHHYLAASGLEVNPRSFGIRPNVAWNQGLPAEKQVIVKTWNIENIARLAILGEEILDTSVMEKPSRAILRLKFPD